MTEVLRRAAQPPEVWEQHRGILDAVVAGDAAAAAAPAARHVESAAERLLAGLAADAEAPPLAAALG
jgi:DNA-binding GntR family transcriptional regulator